MTDLIVSEVFGPTIQGEGPSAGRIAGFVRLGRCNLDCRWCDTAYTWDWRGKNGIVYDPKVELHRASVSQVVHAVEMMDVPLVVITGGEPLLQRTAMHELIVDLLGECIDVEVETNGTQPPPLFSGPAEVAFDDALWWNVSPKLTHSGVDPERALDFGVLRTFVSTGRARFKFVVSEPGDLDEVARIVHEAGIVREDVWVMPEGRDAATLDARLASITEAAIARRYNVTGRLHVSVWGEKRGV